MLYIANSGADAKVQAALSCTKTSIDDGLFFLALVLFYYNYSSWYLNSVIIL